MRRGSAALILAAVLASGASSPAGPVPTSARVYSPKEPLTWRHSELELFLWSVGESGDRKTVRTARDIVEPNLLAEADRIAIPDMLA